jgi:hypothetical protein
VTTINPFSDEGVPYPFQDFDSPNYVKDASAIKPTRAFRFEISVQKVDTDIVSFMGVDTVGFAQKICQDFTDGNYEIKWRDWEKVDARTNEPIWVVFPSW